METLTLSKSVNSTEEDVFAVGDVVESLTNVDFVDGTRHEVGDKIEITPDTLDYFNFFSNDYRLVKRK